MHRTLTLAALAVALVAPTTRAQNTNTDRDPVAPATRAPGAQAPNAANRQESATRAGQAGQAGQAGARAGGGVDDTLFAAAAASGGLAEVAISQLGAQRATNDELKQFSQQMIEEHTRANRELMSLAQQKRAAIPQSPDVRAQFCQQSLSGLQGEEFDRCYAKAQLIAHMDSVSQFEAEAKYGQDPEIKAWASKMLPRIKEHLAMIKPIAMRYEKDQPDNAGNNRNAGDQQDRPQDR